MDPLRALVLRLANVDRVGGRALIVDRQTLHLYDCAHWSCSCSDTVQSRFPEVQISVRSCRQSLTGFIVVFHYGGSLQREMLWYLLIGLGMACCGYLLFRPPWASRVV